MLNPFDARQGKAHNAPLAASGDNLYRSTDMTLTAQPTADPAEIARTPLSTASIVLLVVFGALAVFAAIAVVVLARRSPVARRSAAEI